MNARSRNDALNKLSSYGEIILEHILKKALYPGHQSVKHWETELDAFAGKLCKYREGKSGSKNFTDKILMERIYFDHITDIGLDFVETYGPTEVPLDLEKIKDEVRIFAKKVLENS